MNALQIAGLVLLVALLVVLRFVPAHACCDRYLDLPASTRGLHLKEWHHGYLVLLALIPSPFVQWPALVIGADDLFGQHVFHLFKGHERLRSPLHHLAARTWYRWRQ